MGKGKVLQDWMGNLPWKQQSVILSSLRGPDTHRPINVKKVTRWLREITQNCADPSTDYMKKLELPQLNELKEDLEFCSVHYFCHLLHTFEIIGYTHPDIKIKNIANNYYSGLVDALHLNPENKEQMNKRLEDKV
ncbi:hypothetical protein HYS72_01855 [Candidatus Pacearchaeota archaeon]|nr:hypothetical protein [Candidatus Pacearchaeota archaeon]MBI2057086.1 hypothetical protein [Candidatus Pacearchaeota archaeon]